MFGFVRFMKFSDKFQRLRERRGATIRDVATALDMGVGTVGGWANGATPRPKVATKLADYFGVPVETLLDDDADLPPSLYPPSPVSGERATAADLIKIREQLAAQDAALAAKKLSANPEFQRLMLELATLLLNSLPPAKK